MNAEIGVNEVNGVTTCHLCHFKQYRQDQYGLDTICVKQNRRVTEWHICDFGFLLDKRTEHREEARAMKELLEAEDCTEDIKEFERTGVFRKEIIAGEALGFNY